MAGRGGAGNINAANEKNATQFDDDLEANKKQRPISERTVSSNGTNQARQPDEYAHGGRGGAGNFYSLATSSKDDASTGVTGESLKPSDSKLSESARKLLGRGGAGNFVQMDRDDSNSSAAWAKAHHESVLENAERDVEKSLGKPEKAYQGGNRERIR